MGEKNIEAEAKKGFTLIEIIASLLLLGVMAAIAGMGLEQVVNAYSFAKNAADYTMDGQLAIGRISKSIRSAQNINTSTTFTKDDKITIQILRGLGSETFEKYHLYAGTLYLDKLDSLNGPTDSSHILAENVSVFRIQYLMNGNASPQDSISGNLDGLRKIIMTLTFNTFNDARITFVSQVTPRNIYAPLDVDDFSDYAVDIGNFGCFIGSTIENEMNLHPSIFIMISIFASVFLFVFFFMKKNRKMDLKKMLNHIKAVNNQKGSSLLGMIVLIVALGFLGASIISMLSTTGGGSITTSFSQRAYYMAESGYRDILFTYIQAQENGQDGEAAIRSMVGRQYNVSTTESFTVGCQSFWFVSQPDSDGDNQTLEISSPISYPDTYDDVTAATATQNYAVAVNYADVVNGYRLYLYNTAGNPLSQSPNNRLNLATAPTPAISNGLEVFPASNLATQTLQEGGDLQLSNQIDTFPYKNGAINIIDSSNGTVMSIVTYETADYATGRLLNIKSAGQGAVAIPAGGLNLVTGNNFVALHKNVFITATGQVGSGAFQAAARRFGYFQPLLRVNLMQKTITTENFDNLDNVNTVLGNHDIIQVDDQGIEGSGDSALRVIGTDVKGSAVATWAYSGKSVQESIIEVDPNQYNFDDAWGAGENETLSYELQTKISFQAFNDIDTSNPMGTYMPGLLFRVRELEADASLRQYFGLSFVRSIFKPSCISTPDVDDIPDQYLFQNHGENDLYTESEYNSYIKPYLCNSGYLFQESWNDTELISGLPYVMLWQQVALNQSYDDGLWSPPVSGLELEADWLANIPLCKQTARTVYQYVEFDGNECDLIQFKSERYWSLFFGWRWPQPSSGTWPHCEWVNEPWPTADHYNAAYFSKCDAPYNCDESCSDTEVRYYYCNSFSSGQCTQPDIHLDEIWTTVRRDSDPRKDSTYEIIHNATELEDNYGIFVHNEHEVDGTNYSIFGEPTGFNSIVVGADDKPVTDKAYIYPNDLVSNQKRNNYRLYLKPWITLHARIIEVKDDFFEETRTNINKCGTTDEERVNIIQAYFADVPRGTITWPDDCETCFEQVIWPDTAYSSKIIEFYDVDNGETRERRICERGSDEYPSDSSKRSPTAKSHVLTTEDYDDTTIDKSEVGLHTFGIDAGAGEHVYFDDFAVMTFKKSAVKGLLPSVQFEM